MKEKLKFENFRQRFRDKATVQQYFYVTFQCIEIWIWRWMDVAEDSFETVPS